MILPNSRAHIRIQQIARYRVSGRLSDKQIADLVGMSPQGLRHLIEQPDYIEVENALLDGHISKMDMELAGNIEELRNHMRYAVPAAQRTLLEAVLQRRDLRTALLASKEILDRDPDHTFSKVSVNSGGNPNDPSVAGGQFNPAATGEMLVSLQADASRVTMQVRASGGPPQPKVDEPKTPEPPTIIAEQMPLFNVEEGRF